MRPSSERLVVAVAAIASFLMPFSGAATNVALPSLARDLRLDAVLLSWVGMAFLLAAAVALVPLGRLADIHGRKRVFTWGVAAYSSTSFACALAPEVSSLIAARVIQGISGAAMFGTNVAILTSVLPPGRRGAALGANVAAVYLGLSLGPVLGGVLTDRAGWRSLFYLSGALGLVLVVVVRLGLRGEWAESRGEPFDGRGTVLYALSVLTTMYGLSLLPALPGAAFLAVGIGATAVFVVWERRTSHPLLPMDLFFSNRVFALSNLAALINYAATFAVGFLLSLDLQYAKGLSAQTAGLVLAAQPALMTIVSPFAGRLSDRVETRIVASLGMGTTVVGLALLCAVSHSTSLVYVVLCLAVLGCGFGLFSSPNTNAVMGAVDKRRYGVASATLGTMRLSGQMLSMAVAMLLLALFVGRETLSAAHRDALVRASRTTFAVFALLCVAGTFASLARGTDRKH